MQAMQRPGKETMVAGRGGFETRPYILGYIKEQGMTFQFCENNRFAGNGTMIIKKNYEELGI